MTAVQSRPYPFLTGSIVDPTENAPPGKKARRSWGYHREEITMVILWGCGMTASRSESPPG
jgi:hypothetical protein